MDRVALKPILLRDKMGVARASVASWSRPRPSAVVETAGWFFETGIDCTATNASSRADWVDRKA